MNVIILGAGKIGFQLARQLMVDGFGVVVIEKDRRIAHDVDNRLDCLVINDIGSNIESLQKAGAAKADYFVAVTDSDEINMFACSLVSSEFGKPITIARVRNVTYRRARFFHFSSLGIDHAINPEIEAALAVCRAIEHGGRSDVMVFDNAKFQMRNFSIGGDSPLADTAISDIRRQYSFDFLITAVARGGNFFIPAGKTVLRDGDEIYVLASGDNFKDFFTRKKENIDERISRILLIGCGNIGCYIADTLLNRDRGKEAKTSSFFNKLSGILKGRWNKNLHIVDRDGERCKNLAEWYPEALITRQDITDEGTLQNRVFGNSDIIVTATGSEELNLITAVYAKTLGIPKSIALVTQKNYRDIGVSLKVDVTISLNNNMVNSILQVIRRSSGGRSQVISGGSLEVVEYLIQAGTRSVDRRIGELKMPADSLIVFVNRDGREVIPDGSFVLKEGDKIVVISDREQTKKIEAIFHL